MRRMLHQHLLQRAEIGPPVGLYLAGAHLDEDALSAFVEGRLSDFESAPVISHLVNCNTCRRFTAELVRLETEVGFVEPSAPPPSPAEQPGRIRRLLEDLATRVLPDSDEVFAYHAPADDFEPKDDGKEQAPHAHEATKRAEEDHTDQKSE